jgi:hypothetical protein
MRRRLLLFLIPFVTVVQVSGATGQPSGGLGGRITDQTGAPLPGVVVTVASASSQISTSTAESGEFRIALAPGRYAVRFSLVGFADHSRTDVEVAGDRDTRVDATLQVTLRSEVTVTGPQTFRNLAEIDRPEASLAGIAVSASEGAVTGRQLARRPIQRAGEIIESVPGVSVTQHSGEGKANQYYLRGFNLDHGTDFSTTVAGVPINLPSHAHGHGYTDTNFLIPELVTGVQYFKGPYTADAGDFSSAGGVNVNYASVLDAPMVRVSGGGQGWGRVFAAASPRIGTGHLLAAAEVATHDGPWVQPDRYQRRNAVVRYSRGNALDNFAVSALAYDASWNATDQAPQRAVSDGTLPRFGGVDSTTGGETSRYTLSSEWQRGDSTARTHVTGYLVGYRLDLFSNFTYALDDPINGDQFHQADRRVVSGGRISHERLGRLIGRPVEYRAGAQLRRDDIGRVGLYRTRARRRLSTVRQDDVTQTSVGLWADADVRWTPWLRWITGVRTDVYRFGVVADLAENSGRDVDAIASPKASVVVGPWKGTELYANAGTGFHSNDARGATIAVDASTGETVGRVTPLARTRGAELGLRTVAIPGVQSTLAVWRLSLDSELVFVGDAGTTAASRPSERYGIEWSTFARVRRWLTVDGDVAWSHARFTDIDPSGSYVPGAVERVASLGVTADAGRRFYGSARWRYFGSRPLIEDNSVRSRATSLVNAQVGYRLTNRFSVIVDAFNLLDAKHSDVDYFYTSRLPGEPSEGVADFHTHPALPRSARVTLGVSF